MRIEDEECWERECTIKCLLAIMMWQSKKLCLGRGKRQKQMNYVYTQTPQQMKKKKTLSKFQTNVPTYKLYSP